jgi:hypothetical protein
MRNTRRFIQGGSGNLWERTTLYNGQRKTLGQSEGLVIDLGRVQGKDNMEVICGEKNNPVHSYLGLSHWVQLFSKSHEI